MKALGTKLALHAALLLLLFGAVVPLRAQGLNSDSSAVDLSVCNKGTVPVVVVAAQKNDFPMLYWDVDGATVAPGECKQVYWSSAGYPAYIAFGFADAKGQWGSGKIAQVPDLGTFVRWFHDQKILTGAAVALCAQKDATGYRSTGDMPVNCTGLKYVTDWSGHLIAPDARYGPLLPLTSALYLETVGQNCTDDWGNRGVACHHYLNIAPSATDRELHATTGTDSGGASQNSGGAGTSQSNGDASPGLCGKVSCWDYFAQGVRQAEAQRAKAAAEERQKQEQAAEAQRQAELAAATPPPPATPSSPPPGPPADDPIGGGGFITPPTSFNALMCLPADLAHNSSWKPGGKMAAFQDMAASYIASVAKPGWEYWISQAQYERFEPGTTASGDQFVSAVSPDSGRFDEFDPQCPSGYEGFLVQVHH